MFGDSLKYRILMGVSKRILVGFSETLESCPNVSEKLFAIELVEAPPEFLDSEKIGEQ